MTTNVGKGAGRAKAAQRKKKHDQKDVVVGAKDHTPALKKAAKKPAAKPRADKDPAPVVFADGWDDLGAAVARERELGTTWRRIGELANENGHDVPWPDGGRLLRAMKAHLGGGPAPSSKPKGAGKGKTAKRAPLTAKEREEMFEANSKARDVPWDSESSEEDIIAFCEGRTLFFVSNISGEIQTAKCPKPLGKHTSIRVGAHGPYITFASMEGPFRSISLSRIVRLG